jgi:heme/copper-type cytochrome/quinol oxidase subunit 4
MTLRAPVDYWQAKATKHETASRQWMLATFSSMVGLAIGLGVIATWVFFTLDAKGQPDAWKLAVLALVGVLGVWAVRLVVRVFLSHMHLATDAEERVTMVKTYLSLLESEKMPNDDDRKLVLTPLFRPASDGIVKDEGLPHPLLEWFTKNK